MSKLECRIFFFMIKLSVANTNLEQCVYTYTLQVDFVIQNKFNLIYNPNFSISIISIVKIKDVCHFFSEELYSIVLLLRCKKCMFFDKRVWS